MGLTGIAALAAIGCRLDRATFDNRVFSCDIAAPDPACGTDETGQLMACFAARQIGATDFCAKQCDVNATATNGTVCLASGIALQSCNPTEKTSCGGEGLACYRTDLLSDEGVCTTMNPCDKDTACKDPVRSVCATTFLASLYAQGDHLKRDHLFCLQTGCRARGTACSPGETCLQDVIPADSNPPDICVPNCDSNLNCPPNFLCYRRVSTSIAPNVCIPGLLGFTCDSGIDCMLGDCTANGIGYKVCTAPCDSDADCQRYDGIQGKFSCIKNGADPTSPGLCQTPNAYRGSICETSTDCARRNVNEICNRFNAGDALGTCLLPCASDGKCSPRGGINHTCLPSVAPPVCFPGFFGFPCSADDNCVGDLVCHPTIAGTPSVCTRTCSPTVPCGRDRWVDAKAWCSPLGVCLAPLGDGESCPTDEACQSGHCIDAVDMATGNLTKHCAPSAEAM